MLFLMNDQVMQLNPGKALPPLDAARFRQLSFGFVCDLGRELFAEAPMLPYTAPERAQRLAVLIAAKAPRINAALFVAPEAGCAPGAVSMQFAEVTFEVMAWLYQQQKAGQLSHVIADRQVWRRFAA
ncbi:MAG TPA: hypothetical protein VMU37_05565 [Caulobacteraceae bacterium]|nr:hypothetical protein [Caulobacteraceae bacterium]